MRRSWLRSFWLGLILLGAVIGYLVSTGVGERLLHDEVETQLTRLLGGSVEISEVKVRFEGGLRLEARELEAFPSAFLAQPPAIRARSVVAWINPLALLVGRLELHTLTLEGPSLRLVQEADGGFSNVPMPGFVLAPIDEEEDTLSEAVLSRIEGLDAIAESLFERIRAADRVEILDGTIHWVRRAPADSQSEPTEIRLELFTTIVERAWLSEDLSLELSAVVVDGQHAPFPIGVVIERDGDQTAFDWTVTMGQIPLEAAATPLSFIERIDGLSGQLTTVIHLRTAADGARRLKIDGQVHDAILRLRRSRSNIHREKITLHAEIEISEKRLRLLNTHLEGDRLGLDVNASIDRPIRPASNVRLESRMVGFELEDVFELAHSLEAESEAARSFSRLVERVEGGRILYIEASGSARLKHWRDLFSGRVLKFPDGFVLGGAFEEVVVAAGPSDRIEGLQGKVEWVGDRITLREAVAQFRGDPLPRMNVVLEGASHLARAPDSERDITIRPPPIPGLMPLLELFRPKDPNSLPPVKAIGLAIDRLEHPIFRFPFRDLRVLIEPKRRGMDAHIRSGIWGGASVTGDLQWSTKDGTPALSANLVLGDAREESTSVPPDPSADESDSPDGPSTVVTKTSQGATPTRPQTRWGTGKFELEFRPRPKLPFRSATGFFHLDGTKLFANEFQFQVEPVGQIASRIVLDMEAAEQVGVDLSFALTEGRLEDVSEFIGLPPDLATGGIRATGSLRGTARPDEPLIGKLDGRIRVEADRGKIRMEIPLLLRLSRASEGFNPFSNQDEMTYDTMTASIDFQQGSLLAEDFEIDGPVRVYTRGQIDPFADPSQARGVVGIFLFRAPNQILESLPLVRYFLPGDKRGLVGAYFKVKGPLAEPSVEALTVDTLMTVVPAAIKAPLKVLQYLFDPSGSDK